MPRVFDIRKPITHSFENFIVFADTNAIVDLFYDKSSYVANAKVQEKAPYHAFIGDLWENGITLHIPATVVMEMYGIFQKYDMSIYNKNHPTGQKAPDIKTFRSQLQDRSDCKRRYTLITQQLTQNSHIAIEPVNTSSSDLFSFVSNMDTHAMDSNDFILSSMLPARNGLILTDDKDFSVPNVSYDIATKNPVLIDSALRNGYILAN